MHKIQETKFLLSLFLDERHFYVSGSDSDDELFDSLDLVPIRKKMGLIPETETCKRAFQYSRDHC